LLLFTAFIAAAALLAPSRGAAAPAIPDALIAPAVIDALQRAPSVSVIVSLKQDSSPAQPAGRAAITARADRVLASVAAADFQPTYRYGATPAIAGRASAGGVQALAKHPDVLSVALDIPVHASLAQTVPLIRADNATTTFGVTGAGVVVAVLDTGIDTDHPMLADSITHQECFLMFATCPGGPNVAEDGHGHGTHVSGIITSNGPPIGIAPDASIQAYKVLDDTGNGSLADALAAYDHIILNHPEVDLINISFSDNAAHAPGSCESIIPALTADVATTRTMGITSFSASGNTGSKTGIGYPACINDIVSVGATYDANIGPHSCDATTEADKVACFSESDESLDLVAPGSAIESTYKGGGLLTQSGTSMASPAAAAVAALLLESEPSLTPAQVEARLVETGKPVVDSLNGVRSCRVDAYEAVANDGGNVCGAGIASVGGTSEATVPSHGGGGERRAPVAVAILAAAGVAAAALIVRRGRRRRAAD